MESIKYMKTECGIVGPHKTKLEQLPTFDQSYFVYIPPPLVV